MPRPGRSSRARCRRSARRTSRPRPRRRGCPGPARARSRSMFRQYMPIQAVPSACSRWPPVGSGAERSNTPMLSRPRKPPWKTFRPSASLRLTHQVKLSSSLWKTRSRNRRSRCPRDAPLDLVDAPGGPRVHRRVHVAERPLVGRELAVGVHVPLAQEEDELLLREAGSISANGMHVERQVPGGVPGVLPLVGHRDDVAVVEVRPLGWLRPAEALRRRRPGRPGRRGASG